MWRDDKKSDRGGSWLEWGLAALVGFGIALWQWRRQQPVRETHRRVPHPQQPPPSIPDDLDAAEKPLQLTAEGTGPLFHRRYRADIAGPTVSAEALMAEIQQEVDAFSPTLLARFEKVEGQPHQLKVGDEFDIHITGPWNGPVRVAEVTPTRFTLVTLEGHLEAGEIQFRVLDHPAEAEALRFEIVSWARSRDALVAFTYEDVPVTKKAQKEMWVYFCQQVVAASGGTLLGDIEVLTEEAPFYGEAIPTND